MLSQSSLQEIKMAADKPENLVFLTEDAFLNFFIQKDQVSFKKSRNFFSKLVGGEVKAFTTTGVILDVAEELEKEGWKKEEIIINLNLILSTPNLKINFKQTIFEAIEIYENNSISFKSAYDLAVMKRMKSSLYFPENSDFKKINNLKVWSDE